VKKLGSERVLKWKDVKVVFWGERATLVAYSSEDEYVIHTKEELRMRMSCHRVEWIGENDSWN